MDSVSTNSSSIPQDVNDVIDYVEMRMLDMVDEGDFVIVDLPVKHIFTPGLYAREITMFIGNRITSKIHLTENQFIISKGKSIVFNNGVGFLWIGKEVEVK